MADLELNSLSLWNDGTRRTAILESPASSPAKSQSVSSARLPEAPPNMMLLIEFTDGDFNANNVVDKLKQMERQVAFLREYYGFDSNSNSLKFSEHLLAALYFKKAHNSSRTDLETMMQGIFRADEMLSAVAQQFPFLRSLFGRDRFILTGP